MKALSRTIMVLALLPALLAIPCVASSPSAAQEVPRPAITVPPPPPAAAPAQASPSPANPDQLAPPQLVANPPQVSASYVVGPEDALSVNVWREAAVSGTFTVRPDGMISMPLLGDVQASGLTPMSLAADITNRLKKFITDPLVTVTVTAVNSKHYFLIGEVQRAGSVPLLPGITVMQAIAAAGLTPYANRKHIYILRMDKGKQVKIPFDYRKALKNGDEQGVTLLSGDTIVVP